MQNDKYPFAPPLDGAEKPAPHRRRHRRAGARRAGGQNQTPAAPAQPQKQQSAPAQPQKQQSGTAQAQKQQSGTVQAQKQQSAPVQPKQGQGGPARGAQRRGQRPERQRPQAQPQRASAPPEDPGLPLIARRAPKQKYANFEEYIAAHGGVTAPLPGDETPPAGE